VAIAAQDYNDQDLDIAPIADPQMSSDTQRMMRATALLELTQNPLIGPKLDARAIAMRYLQAIGEQQGQQIITPPSPQEQQPPPELIKIQADHQRDMAELQLKQQALQIDAGRAQTEQALAGVKAQEMEAKKNKITADAMKDVADTHIASQKVAIDAAHLHIDNKIANAEVKNANKDRS
jgi:hypothetical protein